jgi:starvation-inducible DNA-binding protein
VRARTSPRGCRRCSPTRPLVEKAEQAGDVATADLVTERITIHEKTAWMLRSSLA